MENTVITEYKSTLRDLIYNSKPLINVLTMLAEENIAFARHIALAIEEHIQNVETNLKLPGLYLIDSIIKNVGKGYKALFNPRIGAIFTSVYQKVDQGSILKLKRLYHTWKKIVPNEYLSEIEANVEEIDALSSIPSQRYAPTAENPSAEKPQVSDTVSKEGKLSIGCRKFNGNSSAAQISEEDGHRDHKAFPNFPMSLGTGKDPTASSARLPCEAATEVRTASQLPSNMKACEKERGWNTSSHESNRTSLEEKVNYKIYGNDEKPGMQSLHPRHPHSLDIDLREENAIGAKRMIRSKSDSSVLDGAEDNRHELPIKRFRDEKDVKDMDFFSLFGNKDKDYRRTEKESDFVCSQTMPVSCNVESKFCAKTLQEPIKKEVFVPGISRGHTDPHHPDLEKVMSGQRQFNVSQAGVPLNTQRYPRETMKNSVSGSGHFRNTFQTTLPPQRFRTDLQPPSVPIRAPPAGIPNTVLPECFPQNPFQLYTAVDPSPFSIPKAMSVTTSHMLPPPRLSTGFPPSSFRRDSPPPYSKNAPPLRLPPIIPPLSVLKSVPPQGFHVGMSAYGRHKDIQPPRLHTNVSLQSFSQDSAFPKVSEQHNATRNSSTEKSSHLSPNFPALTVQPLPALPSCSDTQNQQFLAPTASSLSKTGINGSMSFQATAGSKACTGDSPATSQCLDISELLDKLVAAGLISENSQHVDQVKDDKAEMKAEIPSKEPPPRIEFNLKSLQKLYPNVRAALLTGNQCVTCGVRIVEDGTEQCKMHRDDQILYAWTEKDSTAIKYSRKWYYETDDWTELEDLHNFARFVQKEDTDPTDEASEKSSEDIPEVNEASNEKCSVSDNQTTSGKGGILGDDSTSEPVLALGDTGSQELEKVRADLDKEDNADFSLAANGNVPHEEDIVGITTCDAEQSRDNSKDSEKIVMESNGIVLKINAGSLRQSRTLFPSNRSVDQEEEENEIFRPPATDPRFTVLPPVQKGVEMSGLCRIM